MSDRPYLIADSHLDLGFSAIQVNRDLTQPAATVRVHDAEPVMRSFGSCTVTFPELRRGHVGIIFGTMMSRTDPNDRWTRTGMYCQEQCHGVGRGHLAYYQAMEREGVIRFIRNSRDMDETVAAWENPAPDTPIGLVVAMESADPILDPSQVPEWYDLGLRIVSISHYGVSSYCHGTGTEGGLLERGEPLLDALKEAGIIVDLTHTTDQAFWEILEVYDGPVAASHHNCRALTPGQRQLTDEMIEAIVERGGVIGAAFDAWMLDPTGNVIFHVGPRAQKPRSRPLRTISITSANSPETQGMPALAPIWTAVSDRNNPRATSTPSPIFRTWSASSSAAATPNPTFATSSPAIGSDSLRKFGGSRPGRQGRRMRRPCRLTGTIPYASKTEPSPDHNRPAARRLPRMRRPPGTRNPLPG